MIGWNERSIARKRGVDPRLIEILNITRQRTGIPFQITEGLRDIERQRELLTQGKSQTLNSKHLTGNALDIHIPDGKGGVNWDFEAYRPIGAMAKQVAQELGYNDFTWGGDWKSLRDGVHFQIGGQHATAQPKRAQQTVSTNSPSILPTMEAQPMQPEKAGGLLGRFFPDMSADRADQIRLGINGMLHNPNAALQAAILARMGERRDTRARTAQQAEAQVEANKTVALVDKFVAGGLLPPEWSDIARTNPAMGLEGIKQATTPKETFRQVTGETARAMGLDPSRAYNIGPDGKVTGIGAGDTNINIQGQAPSPATGYQNIFDNEGRLIRQEPIPGGPVDNEMRAAEESEAKAAQAREEQAGTRDNVVINQLDAIRGMIQDGGPFDLPEVGIVGNALGRLGVNQEAVSVRNRLETLQGMVSFDQLNKMREASPTGGALGQITERELSLLSAQLGTLNQSSDAQAILQTLDLLEGVMRKADAYPNAGEFGFGGGASMPSDEDLLKKYGG